MWEFFIRHNRFSYLIVVALVLVGGYSLVSIPRESTPEVSVPVGIVTTTLPGAPAADIEALVTNEIERSLTGALEKVKTITSVSREGLSSVTVEFEASANIDDSIADLKDKVDTIAPQLPDDATDPRVTQVNFVDQPIMSIAVGAPIEPLALSELATAVQNQLETVPGVSKVTPVGSPARTVSVLVDPTKLAQYDLSVQALISGLQAANSTVPVGQITHQGVMYNIAFEGDIPDTAAVAGTPIAARGGQPVYVRDVATVVDGVTDAASFARLSVAGQPSDSAVTFDVYKQSGGDITKIAATVNDKLDSLQETGSLLAPYSVEVMFDQGADIATDLGNLTRSGLQTVVLVMIVLIIALGWREAFIAGLAIPLSFLIGFIGLYASGNTINFLSLFSLILGIGILVDSGIVMVEGIHRRLKEHPTGDKREAAITAVHEFASPLISGTLTTVAMFSGLFIVSGVTGQFIANIPLTLIFILFASMFVALAILPLFSATFLHRRVMSPFESRQTELTHRAESWYRRKLAAMLDSARLQRRFLWGIRLALVVAILLPVLGVVQVIFFPQSDVDYLYVEVELPPGTTNVVTDRTMRQVEETLYHAPDIASFVTTVGSGSQFGSGAQGEQYANAFVVLNADRTHTSSELVLILQESLQHITTGKVVVSQPNNGPPTGAAVSVTFSGDDLGDLTTTAAAAADILSGVDGVTNIQTAATDNTTEFVLTVDRARVASLGLSPQSVSFMARNAVFGNEATTLTTLDTEIPVWVQLQLTPGAPAVVGSSNEATIDAVRALPVPLPSGDTVPLGSLVDISLRESSASITHKDGVREMTVSADVLPDVNSREAQSAYLAALSDALTLPEGVTQSTGGASEDTNRSFIEMFAALIVGVILMVGILVYEFNSFLHTRYVLTILPYSIIGIMAGLAITGNSLSFPSLMGFIALSGIVVNNSILLIDMMNSERVKQPEKPIRDVVLDAAASRLRPILLTTTTTIIGMIPLTYADDIWSPLAYAVMFGLLFSVVVTLVLIPIIYLRKPGTVNS